MPPGSGGTKFRRGDGRGASWGGHFTKSPGEYFLPIMISYNIQVNMWLRATTSLWFNGQFELYPTNITASYEPSEFAWQIALISLQHLRLCFIQVNMWLRATTEQQAQSRSGENEPSERGKHIICCFLQKWKKTPESFCFFFSNSQKLITK